MYDLIYVEEADYKRAWQELQVALPGAKLEDASDYIHTSRFSVEVDMPQGEYMITLLRLGMAKISLVLGLKMVEDPEGSLALARCIGEGGK